MADFLKLGTRNVRLVIDIIMKCIDKDWKVGIGTQHMLHLVRLNHELGHGTRHLPHILRMSPLLIPHSIELTRHKVHKACIKARSPESSIPRSTQNFKGTHGFLLGILALLPSIRSILDHTNLNTSRSHVVKQIRLRLGINTINPKMQRRGTILINQRQDIQLCQLRSIQQGASFMLGVKVWNGQYAILHGGGNSIRLRDILGVREYHGDQFLGCEFIPINRQADPRPSLVVLRRELIMPLFQNLHAGVLRVPSQHDAHLTGCQMGLSCH
mmetsp:Transcript_2057/g.4528  ORF Transcript_2057/g.4528 Transcript_2057/m.4528 type:complete len:270 (-) Transcript_2057:333-1142(-)